MSDARSSAGKIFLICLLAVAAIVLVGIFSWLSHQASETEKAINRFNALSAELDQSANRVHGIGRELVKERGRLSAIFQKGIYDESANAETLQKYWDWYQNRWEALKEIGTACVAAEERIVAIRMIIVEAFTENDEAKMKEAEDELRQVAEDIKEMRRLFSGYHGAI